METDKKLLGAEPETLSDMTLSGEDPPATLARSACGRGAIAKGKARGRLPDHFEGILLPLLSISAGLFFNVARLLRHRNLDRLTLPILCDPIIVRIIHCSDLPHVAARKLR